MTNSDTTLQLRPMVGLGNVFLGSTPETVVAVWSDPLRDILMPTLSTPARVRRRMIFNNDLVCDYVNDELKMITFSKTKTRNVTFDGSVLSSLSPIKILRLFEVLGSRVFKDNDDIVMPELALWFYEFEAGEQAEQLISVGLIDFDESEFEQISFLSRNE